MYDRTKRQAESAKKYAANHPAEASLAVASLLVATVYFPVPVIAVLAIGILALLAFNALQEPSFLENARMQVEYSSS